MYPKVWRDQLSQAWISSEMLDIFANKNLQVYYIYKISFLIQVLTVKISQAVIKELPALHSTWVIIKIS
jgi:hypothetical protein